MGCASFGVVLIMPQEELEGARGLRMVRDALVRQFKVVITPPPLHVSRVLDGDEMPISLFGTPCAHASPHQDHSHWRMTLFRPPLLPILS
jgi:hypothetical protein